MKKTTEKGFDKRFFEDMISYGVSLPAEDHEQKIEAYAKLLGTGELQGVWWPGIMNYWVGTEYPDKGYAKVTGYFGV